MCFHSQVRARTSGQPGQERTSDASVTIKLVDINDNFPEFEQNVRLVQHWFLMHFKHKNLLQIYSMELLESALPKSHVLTVKATDRDTGDFGSIRYSIDGGDGAEAFTIHPVDGHIQVSFVNYSS